MGEQFILLLFYFFKDFVYLFMRDTEREAETQAEGEAGSSGSPMRDSIPGPQDHALSQMQTLNRGATQVSPVISIHDKDTQVVLTQL